MVQKYPSTALAVAFLIALLGACSSRDDEPVESRPDGDPDVTPAGSTPATSPPGDAGRAPAADTRSASPEASRSTPDVAADAPAPAKPDGPQGPGATPDALAMTPPPATAFQCARDSDCTLVNDCCSCTAIGRSERAPACDPKTACLIPKCSEHGGVEKPRCMAGRCVLGFDCDTSEITCKRAAPVCQGGQVPQVVMQGGQRCYGACVDARQCLAVPTCTACAKGDLCVRTEPSPQPLHCLPPPAGCGGAAACTCAAICAPPFSSCHGSQPPVNLTCECMNC